MEVRRLGNNIASERAKLGLTQKEVAEKIGVSEKSVARWERGEIAPQATALKSLHGLFGCTVDYLLGLTEERI
ncbi:helix-turn-helix domain-containing protein [Gordonibacter sp. ResAG-26]|uniref:Helix-turn-helix domain-containing protein n=1 Tax=Gordonibacter urolithinfaciens TaxID=1335613 RepID=A0A6N8IDL7_9ACTN|nr:helix-turn-helix domain-containing protein [Gordonibacter urolithinfaciens]MVN13994.1 helix-turn-helix domain-containing protein [Gordonibacter urolithinfaciens]MVN37637.1 helix-turn-helix domain-containing protein [Gordonibacter urolithinfaciens]MVN54964.1 helix-turn-helix domain-containing protein [Gordonibacter urolithinfaciens]MVN60874.1 helix-turn-helix domain-containing protein [Gordonibacter urolithinfaciens]